ncbi:hypothetical protein [Sphingomonas sp. MMS24-J13]|uniref:hypothetical protein n=1 Tax=Sphingomonas sp. MMS24-J13 TaxID=3238686 RepID=UPI00384B8E4B
MPGTDAAPEPVKLVVWNPDETLWQGMLADGAVKANQPNQDIVIELCRRGILSSLCATSDFNSMRRLLRTFGLWDFFLFPSISWSSVAARIERIIEAMNISPAAVLFIDDNGSNRATAQARIPDVQVAGPELLASILTDPRFAGTDDPGLIRFSRYKLLELQAGDAPIAAESGNDDFLRLSGIIATIESDVAGNIDRAIDLINHTNWLNFTKKRLPSDRTAARQALGDAMKNARAGLVRLSDDHDDHGLCGFFLMRGEPPHATLDHLCFSSRIAGMGIEHWLYEKIGRPGLVVAGKVAADLSTHGRTGWVNAGAGSLAQSVPDISGIVIRGGAEIDTIARYCHLNSSNVRVETDRREWHVVLPRNSSTNLMLSLHQSTPETLRELHVIGFREPDLSSPFWAVPPGGIGILSLWGDLNSPRYRHRGSGLEVAFRFDLLPDDFGQVTKQHLAEFARAKGLTEETAGHVRQFVDYFARHYEFLPPPLALAQLRTNLHAIFAAFPWSARLFVLLPPSQRSAGESVQMHDLPEVPAYNDLVRAIAAAYSHVEVIDPAEFAGKPGRPTDMISRATGLRIYRAVIERNAAAQVAL